MSAIEVHSQEHDGHLSSVLDSHSYSLEVTSGILLSPPLEMEARTKKVKEPESRVAFHVCGDCHIPCAAP